MTINEETRVGLTCPSCGNDQNFLVKTLQMHVVHIDGGTNPPVEALLPIPDELMHHFLSPDVCRTHTACQPLV